MFGTLAPDFVRQRFSRRVNGKQLRFCFRITRYMTGDGEGVGRKGVEIDLAQSAKPLNLFGHRREDCERVDMTSQPSSKPVCCPGNF